jgi:hypothetical protein
MGNPSKFHISFVFSVQATKDDEMDQQEVLWNVHFQNAGLSTNIFVDFGYPVFLLIKT